MTTPRPNWTAKFIIALATLTIAASPVLAQTPPGDASPPIDQRDTRPPNSQPHKPQPKKAYKQQRKKCRVPPPPGQKGCGKPHRAHPAPRPHDGPPPSPAP
ncbi:hypothetical protein SAMN02745157_3983 [Kaistia soli DSM 19436]|uniref:Uncharacterized protein n=1 Tax=Kaistia soli DSM 19436 TaxID=1122133 RepID=A0A1M5ISA9_9HYPH|nr:hypothetical protein [Kaistia soli]SHG31105.1 hypothetical protein SAMN02745157_3983 [Kaistia soli DSM 19436]